MHDAPHAKLALRKKHREIFDCVKFVHLKRFVLVLNNNYLTRHERLFVLNGSRLDFDVSFDWSISFKLTRLEREHSNIDSILNESTFFINALVIGANVQKELLYILCFEWEQV